MTPRLISGLWSIFITILVESAMDRAHQRLQIETQSRDYRSGPIDGVFMASTHELMYLTVEDQDKPGDDGIWQWAMMTDEDSGSIGCVLSKIYHRGESATMICPKTEGIYYAFAKRAAVSSLSEDDRDGLEEYLHKNESYCAADGHCLLAFILNHDADEMESAARFAKAKEGSVVSDPVKIVASQYCFLWAYTIDEEDRVGYVSTQAEQTETEGSYIRYRLRMWITEANAMNESELEHQFPQTEYAGVLTRRFKTKGLEPCIRYSHQSIEIETAVPTYVYDPSGVGVFWTMFLKAHTNTVLAALSDLSFTIASRQHIGLYGCYVAETRVLLDTRQFSFLKAQRNEMSKINLANSYLPPVLRRYMTTRLKHVFGHYIQYIGRPWHYESAAHRRDVQVFQNPCMTLEFVFAVRGVAYMAQNWLVPGSAEISQVALPSLTDGIFLQTGSDGSNQTASRSPNPPASSSSNQTASSSSNQTASSSSNQTSSPDQATGSSLPYIKVYDFVFTSMHLVLLTADSHIFLHPTSITYEGFGLIRETQSYRPGALVSRRWCASTGTPKEHNMIVPAFSGSGNLIFIQIVPGDETTTMWVHTPSQTCAQPKRSGEGKNKKGNEKGENEKSKEEMADFLEYCIHHREIPKIRSKLDDENVEKEEEKQDKCKEILQIVEKAEDSPEEIKHGKDTLLAYWIAGQTLLDEKDPHFYGEEEESSQDRSSQVSTNYNTHTLYEADRRGTKIAKILASNGLDLRLTHMTSGQKKQLWLHDVQFTAIERQFLLAVEFKSSEIKKADFVAAMLNLVVRDQPVRVSRSEETHMLDTDVIFPGVLIVRPTDQSANDSSRLRGSVQTFALNSALNSFVIHLDHWSGGKSQDSLIHATIDGSHARPLGFLSAVDKKRSVFKLRFADKHPTIGGDEGVLKPDVVVSPHGLVSVLLRKANMTDKSATNEERDDYPQAVILGSCGVPEPLRKIMPFKGSSYIFQRLTIDGQILFGDYRLEVWTDAGKNTSSAQPQSTGGFYPKFIELDATKFLATPFESVLRGVNDDAERGDDDDAEANELSSICPFSDFKLHFQRFDFAEVEYQTRITVELVYLGRTIPLEADVLVEFDDHHGISVTIHSAIEENRDQTLVRKTIDIHTFLTPADLEKMYGFWETHEDGQPIAEEIAIFSVTVRPTIVNSHCRSEDLFKTISINVGCNPFTSMRFIPEAVGLKKISFLRSNDYSDRENQWTVWKEGDEYEVTIPRRKINYAQMNLFKCHTETSEKRGYCSVPRHFAKLFKENIYSIHFTKSIVPKFEQRLTRHIRRVTANIFLYNLLGGDMKTNTSLLDSRCHNLAPTCTPNDAACVTGINETEANKLHNRPWTTHFFEQVDQLHQHTDIYRHYRDCFNLWRITADKEKVKVPRGLPLRMSSELYWIFNSTNYNSFSFNKHRNIIFLIRAVALNTPENGFTYCQQLETFFLLQMTGVAPARQPLPWHFYLGLITFVLFVFVLVYFYFARSSRWQSEVSSRRIREEEEKEQREADAKLLEDNDPNSDAFAKWATNLRNVISEKKHTLGSSTPPQKGGADDKIDNSSGDKFVKT